MAKQTHLILSIRLRFARKKVRFPRLCPVVLPPRATIVALRARPGRLKRRGPATAVTVAGPLPLSSYPPLSPDQGPDSRRRLPARSDTLHRHPRPPLFPAVETGLQEVTGPEDGRGQPEPGACGAGRPVQQPVLTTEQASDRPVGQRGGVLTEQAIDRLVEQEGVLRTRREAARRAGESTLLPVGRGGRPGREQAVERGRGRRLRR